MDGIILAAGIGTRMRPLTLDTPKALLPLQDRPILAWSLLSLRGIVDRALIVVHYLKSQIADYMARQTLFSNYALVEQLPTPLGTGHALQCCRAALQSSDFLVINGDDLFAKDSLRRLSREPFAILAARRDDYHRYGVIARDERGGFRAIDEKPRPGSYPAPAPCNIGAYKLNSDIFDFPLRQSVRGEFEITDAVTAVADTREVAVVDCPFWLPIGDPAALAAAQAVDIAPWIC